MSKLYVVATPIGNLEDITFRAVETLRLADAIVAEDTRQTKKLLNHFQIETPLISYHVRSRQPKRDEIVRRLDDGQQLALVSDAGTPALADPGDVLVSQVRHAGHHVIPIPGSSAVTTALSAAGLGGDEFTFVGFLPHKKGRQTKLKAIKDQVMPVVLYESPHRLRKLLAELDELYPHATVCVARELTKKFEEFRFGKAAELLEWYTQRTPKGEIVVIIHL